MKRIILLIIATVFLNGPNNAQNFAWTQKADLPGIERSGAVGFSINNTGYVFGGHTSTNSNLGELWEWDKATNSWTQMADLPAKTRQLAVAFKIGTKGYIATGLGDNLTFLKDLWEYDQATNTWSQKTDFGGIARYNASSFVISGYAYVGMGYSPKQNDLWRYDPVSDVWTQKANLPASARYAASGFSIGNFGYIACGTDGSELSDLWQYSPAANSWTKKATFPGAARHGAVVFTSNGIGYVGSGTDGNTYFTDFYGYNPTLNQWNQVISLPITGRRAAADFSINSKGYMSCGIKNSIYYNDLWEYGAVSLIVTTTTTGVTCHGGQNGSAIANASGGTAPFTYLWNNGKTTATISNLSAATYTVTVTDAGGTSGTATAKVAQPTSIYIDLTQIYDICLGQSVTITANASGGVAPYVYSWSNGIHIGPNYNVTPAKDTAYLVVVTDANGCTASNYIPVFVHANPSAPITVSDTGVICYPNPVKLSTKSGNGFIYQWKKNSVNINGATDSVYFATASGNYKVLISTIYGCSKTSNTATVNIQQINAAINPAGTVAICAGANKTLNAIPATGYHYQWRKNGVNILNAINSTYKASSAGTYKVKITDPVTSCESLSPGTIVIVNCKTASDLSGEMIYPNPSNDQFSLNMTSLPEEPVDINIYDVYGRLIHQYPNIVQNDQFIFGEDLPAGTYFVKVSNPFISKDYRIMKTR